MPPPDDDWWGLWHEPWRDMHPDWWRGLDPAQDALGETFRTGAPTARQAYAWFCARFGIDVRHLFPGLAAEPLPSVPLDSQSLMAAALALGRVGYVSYCLTSSREGLARLFAPSASADMEGWREALRQARARPLPLPAGLAPEATGNEHLQRWAIPLMAQLMDEAAPGAWSRLRLRLPPDMSCIEGVAPPPQPATPAIQRQAWRIWRASFQTQMPLPAGAAPAPHNQDEFIPP